MGKIIIFFLTIFSLCFASDYKTEIENNIKNAQVYYDSLNYQNALQSYLIADSLLTKTNILSDKVKLNIAISYYKLDSLSKSVYYLENAYRLNPYNKTISKNLSILYTKIIGEDIVENDGIYILYKFFNPITEKILLAIMFFVLLYNLVHIVIKKLKHKQINKVIVTSNFLIIILTAVFLSVNSFYIKNFKYGILNDNSPFYSEPINGRVIGNLYKGHKIRVIKNDEDMIFFNYKNELTGWIKRDKLLLVN